MRRKTNKAVFAALGILILLSAILGVFSIIRRADFLNEGNLVMADFSISLGIFSLSTVLLSILLIIFLLKRDKKTDLLQKSFFSELRLSPMFEKWFFQETEHLKKQAKIPRTIAVVTSILMMIAMIPMLILILDEAGNVLPGCVILLGAAGIMFLWRLTDYNKNFVSPLLESVDLKLSSPSAKEAFASQILGKQKQQFTYGHAPQFSSSMALITPDYCYFRQYRNSCVIINAHLRKAVLKKESYTLGLRPHFRVCYVMELYLDSDSLKKPAWRGYFVKQEYLYYALTLMQRAGLPEAGIEDLVQRK